MCNSGLCTNSCTHAIAKSSDQGVLQRGDQASYKEIKQTSSQGLLCPINFNQEIPGHKWF